MTRSLEHVWQEPRPEPGTHETVTETALGRTKPAARVNPIVFFALAALAAAALVGWLIVSELDGSSAASLPGGGPALVSQAQLEQLASKVGHPVYWAGPQGGYSYEVTDKGGRFYVRYLPQGVKAGDPRPNYLVVGTYTAAGAFADLKRASKHDGTVAVGIDRGGISVFSTGRPTSVYFSYPGANYQVEVYSPSPMTARELALGGKVTPVPAR
jgi:hypothetical protein